MTYDELLAMKLPPRRMEEKMNELFEVTVVDLLYDKGYEEQGLIWIEKSKLPLLWEVYDILNEYNPDKPRKKVHTGYVFLPENVEVARKEKC